MVDHLVSCFHGVALVAELAAGDCLNILCEELLHVFAARDAHLGAVVHVCARCHAVEPNSDSLLAHRFRRRTSDRQVGQLFAQAAFVDQFAERDKYAAVVHAGAKVQHRR